MARPLRAGRGGRRFHGLLLFLPGSANDLEDPQAAGIGPVPDPIWDEAARHYDEKGLAAFILTIATTNLFNRLNVTTRQVAGGTWG